MNIARVALRSICWRKSSRPRGSGRARFSLPMRKGMKAGKPPARVVSESGKIYSRGRTATMASVKPADTQPLDTLHYIQEELEQTKAMYAGAKDQSRRFP